ncbi:MAG TPA: hypothetical protein EYP49_20460 [Anaerolineae bacterium]|nr:hypothetical protein [Anaerolineae bacterium]
MATNQFSSSCTAITADTAATITLNYVNYFRLENRTGQVLYVLFDWDSGETEPSSTNFHVAINDGEAFELKHEGQFTAPKMRNARVISAGSGRVAFWGW